MHKLFEQEFDSFSRHARSRKFHRPTAKFFGVHDFPKLIAYLLREVSAADSTALIRR